MISPRQFTSGKHHRNAAVWGPTPLQSFANARLLLHPLVLLLLTLGRDVLPSTAAVDFGLVSRFTVPSGYAAPPTAPPTGGGK